VQAYMYIYGLHLTLTREYFLTVFCRFKNNA